MGGVLGNLGEAYCPWTSRFAPDVRSAELARKTRGFDFLQHAQPSHDSERSRQQRFSNVKAGESLFLEHQDFFSPLRQQAGHR